MKTGTMNNHTTGILESELLKRHGVIHGFTGRMLGNAREIKVRDSLLALIQLHQHRLIMAEQTHSTNVVYLDRIPEKSLVDATDGLVYGQPGGHPKIVLGVRTADCVPLLMFDPQTGMIAAVHAGWRGTLGGIAVNAVKVMTMHDAKPNDIIVVLGPHIGNSCYTVDSDRAGRFRSVFADSPDIVTSENGVSHIDLGKALFSQLLNAGITKTNLEDLNICTKCRSDDYYSYRQNKNITHGEQISLIAVS
jgi:polyphenol oxidase